MMRMYNINLYDSNGDDYNNQNLSKHMEEGDGIYITSDTPDADGHQETTTTTMDAAYLYHPNHVVPRKKKTRPQKKSRTLYTCLSVCTSPTSSSSSSRIFGHGPTKYRHFSRRSLLSLMVLIIVCAVIAVVWKIQESTVQVNSRVDDLNHSNNNLLPKIIQFDHDNDPNYYEPETKVIVTTPSSYSSNYNNTSNVVASSVKACSEVAAHSSSWDRSNNNNNRTTWRLYGQELVQHISEKHGIANRDGGQYSKHFGYGTNVIVNYDGTMMVISYEGVAGFDKAFGTHIDIVRYDTVSQQWTLEQTVTDVTRNHGHTVDVSFQSMMLSYDGQRLFFADGHNGVHVFVYNNNNSSDSTGTTTKNQKLPWTKNINIPDPYVQHTDANNNSTSSKQYQFGIDLATNCDGSMIAISGTTHTNSYTRIYQLQQQQQSSSTTEYHLIGEIQNVRFGGTIAMDQSGTRIVIGTVASEGWRGMIQVFDYDRSKSNNNHQWIRVGQPIVGNKPLDMWGGKVALSYDGTILGVTSKNGDTNHVQVYQLTSSSSKSSSTTTTTVSTRPNNSTTLSWVPLGQELLGTNAHEHFGADIALSADGTVLAVGAPGDNELYNIMMVDGSASTTTTTSKEQPFISGRIYMYTFVPSPKNAKQRKPSAGGEWVRMDHGELHSTVMGKGDLYGQSISLSASGTVVVGGAPRRTGKAYQQILGGVHAYHILGS